VLITQSNGFDHEVVKQKDGKPSLVETTFNQLAQKSRLFKVEHSRDASILTTEKLKQTDVVVLYTTGVLPMKPEDLDAWVKEGGKFLGIHPATDTYHNTEIFQKLIGGEFIDHPWNQDTTITMKVLDPIHAAAKPWVGGESGAGEGLTFKEEIYQHKNFDPATVHVILGLDMEKTELKKPQFIPIAWCKQHGKGRMFYTSLGHREDVWTNPRYQDHLIAAIAWLTGQAMGDAKPNPEVSAREDATAKKVAPKEEEKKADAGPPGPPLPHVPDGFHVETFARAPDIKSPASIAAAPDGRLFVGEDEYNTQPKRDPGLARVKLCVDSDGDGKADKFTIFADKLNSPQGMTFVGGTLYVAHAPLLTAFRDTNNDGVADRREDLVTGLGPVPEGLVHHVPSGLRMGIDGWLYISIGDKGIPEARGRDGKKVTLFGGGVVRVRPDGTLLELYSSHTRNTFDVSVDPLLNLFTRDNTNDGDGWDSRLTQMQRDGEYGYPSLFKHWPDEIIDPIGSYGGGSATGSMYVAEPGWFGTYGESLYTCDWARGILYRHELKRKGATFEPTQETFLKDIRPADVDVDGIGNIYVADWGRRDWGTAGPVGHVFRVRVDAAPPQQWVEMKRLDEAQLLEQLVSPSQIRRVEAQWELLQRKPSAGLPATLMNVAMSGSYSLEARVAALFTLTQIEGENGHAALATLASMPEMREFALRAMADREDRRFGVKTELFAAGLADSNPRVRVQAAIGIGYLGKRDLAAGLVPLTADVDPLVRHAAMQSLRRLKTADVCIAALKDFSKPQVALGAMRTLREFHDANVVTAVAEVLAKAPTPALRQDAIRTLAKLYRVEGKWDGKFWWTPRPDTRGPYYEHAPWSQSSRVATLLMGAIGDRDEPTAKLALFFIGNIEAKEATTTLARMVSGGGGGMRDDAAKALIEMKSSSAEALGALERVVLGDNFDPAVRTSAAGALAAVKGDAGHPVLVRVLTKLDAAAKPPQGLLERVADALSSRAASASQATSLLSLLNATKPPTRQAAGKALMRSKDPTVREMTLRAWQSNDPVRIESLLAAVPALPPESSEPYRAQIGAAVRDKRESVRQKATIALGHIGDASAVKDLVQLARRDKDPVPAIAALAGVDPARTADDQVTIVATLLVENSSKVSKSKDGATYARVLSAAQKFLADPRVPAAKVSSLRTKLMEPGVIYQYMRTDAIPVADAGKLFDAKFPPELTPAGIGGAFTPFSVNGKEVPWKPITVSEPDGKHPLDMPENSIAYFTATYDSTSAGSGYLTCGSDDGLQAWVNGKKVITKDLDRGLKADEDKEVVQLIAGKNTLLFKVNNRGTASGIQARLRSRVPEFEPEELRRAATRANIDLEKGRKLFTETLGCIKCHTLGREDEPKGPFLGDAGGRFDAKHLVESIVKPGAKIAQGFASERILTKSSSAGGGTGGADGDYLGFVTKETADEVHLRDASGKVTVIDKKTITKRTPQQGSIMPDGLADNLGLDEFGSLLGFLQSLK
jgi:putative membrane-bound dehydrogenase-like protein